MEEDDDDLESKESAEDLTLKLVSPSSVKDNIIELRHSFGYDCKRLYNLCLIDDDTLLFASGNLLHYYSISGNSFTLRRTVFGGGVGFIMKNHIPEFDYLTIAENGHDPTVFIYKYPEHDVICQLKNGAVHCFTCGVYSNNGELLATQAGHPDFMLTIWNWQTSSILLRSKAYQNDVLNVTFSHYNPILLSSCGLTHVQFWKMAETFTGLKLKSDLGRFGKTDTCDVYAVHMLADEKVISGCEWGNMLVWEAGLIKLEVTRKARIPCHEKPITGFTWMGNNELMTVGMDGYARIWFWETVELADPPDEDRFVEIDPIYEFRVGDRNENCEIRHLLKAKLDDTDFKYYAQDGSGGVWRCDLNTIDTPTAPKKLFSCHGGRIVAGEPSPISSHIATLGEDGKVNIYNYETEELLIQEPFDSPGGDLLWLDTTVDPSGMVLIIGFANGVLRQVFLELNEWEKPKAQFHLIKAIKPHAVPIVRLSVAPSRNILVACALDKSAFLFHLKENDGIFIDIIALGFLRFTGSPISLHWDTNKLKTLLFGCDNGEVYECELPEPETIDLEKVRPTWCIYPKASKQFKFKSVKSRIRRELEMAATLKRKAKKLRAKKREIKKLMELNPGLQIDDSALADSSEDDEEEKKKPLFIPDPPNPVLWLQYTNQKTIWLSMGGFDAGYIYEIKFDQEEPVSCTIIPQGDDIEIHSYMYIGKYLLFGMQTGQIRIHSVKPNFRELNDFWIISMHDNLNGVIPRIFTSHDGKWFFSIGYDGNVFYYYWKGPYIRRTCPPPTPVELPFKPGQDIEDPNHLSLEQVKVEENLVKLRAFEEAERKRLEPSFVVMQLQVDWITDKTQQHFQDELNAVLEKLKHDVTGACRDAQDLYDLMFLPLEYIPFEVYAVSQDVIVRTFRLPKLKEESESIIEEMEEAEVEEEKGESGTFNAESATTVASFTGHKQRPQPVIIYDFAEKVLLKFYIRILEFFASLKQIKFDELEQVMEVCGDQFDIEEEDELIEIVEEEQVIEDEQEEEEGKGEEEEDEEEGEHMSVIEKAILFLNNTIRETVEVKTLEISIIQQILHTRKAEFNNKVLYLKAAKTKLYDKYKRLQEELIVLDPEIKLPPLRSIVIYHEYPDIIFREPFIPLRSFESILWEKPIKKTARQIALEIAQEQEEEEISIEDNLTESIEMEGEEGELILEEEPSEEWVGNMENPVEKVTERILTIDEGLQEAFNIRCQYEIDIKYVDLLAEISDQELVILQDSELTEKYLVERDEAAKMRRNQITAHIKRLNQEIETTIKNFGIMNEDIKKIAAVFYEAVKGNKFFKFLRRIFEKKFKPQKERDPDDESESESSSEESSSSEEEEAGSGESGDMTAIRLDESHCPAGCDRKLYDLSFELRTEKHSLEQKIYNGTRLNEVRKLEIQELNAKVPAADDFCAKERTNLLIFRHQKDEKLRAVENAVIYSIEGFGLTIREPEESEEYTRYLEALLYTKRRQAYTLREELQRLITSYTEKLRLLLEILEERERLRRLKPVVIEKPPSEKSISIVTIIRPPTPPPPFDFEAYAAERILKLVQRFFMRYLAKYISHAYMQKYIPKVARILGNIGRNFTCELADNIIEVLVENLRRIVPRKYLMHASLDDIRSLFKDIVDVFELDPVEVDPIKVIRQAVETGLKAYTKVRCANKTQRIIFEISKVIVEELPMDDFRSPETPKLMAKLLIRDAVIIPNCLNTETLVDQIIAYAKENMLSAVTLKIIRVFAEDLLKELIMQKLTDVRSVKTAREKVCRDVRRKKRGT